MKNKINEIGACLDDLAEMRAEALKSFITKQLAEDFEPVERAARLQNEFNLMILEKLERINNGA